MHIVHLLGAFSVKEAQSESRNVSQASYTPTAINQSDTKSTVRTRCLPPLSVLMSDPCEVSKGCTGWFLCDIWDAISRQREEREGGDIRA